MKRRTEKMNRILTVEQMTFCEHQSEKYGVSLAKLMDNAGERLAHHILNSVNTIFDGPFKDKKREAVLLIGKGNNGGDGLVAANILLENGVEPVILLCCGQPDTELSKAAFDRLDKSIRVLSANEQGAVEIVENASILADCIFGTGFHGNLRDSIKPIFEACRKCRGFKIACDVPSGVNAGNGQADGLAFDADETVTFHRKKLGLMLSPARHFSGSGGRFIICEDIGIPEQCEDMLEYTVTDYNFEDAKADLPERVPYGHKGTFGRIVSVCGSESYVGAAGLTVLSAMRTGVGLVNLCTAQSAINSLSSRILECTYSAMNTDSNGFMTSENAVRILEKCKGAQCLLIGCGLGHTAETEKLVAELIENADIPIVLDADGINSLCPNIDILLKKKNTVTLTPHPAELARLCKTSAAEILSDRYGFAYSLAEKYGVTVVSKSAETIVCHGKRAAVVLSGNTALSKGGSGDMLAGIIASYIAQGVKPFEAAALGSYTLGKTAELASAQRSQRGVIATDILDTLPDFLKKLED